MKFIFEDNRSEKEERIANAALNNNWLISDIFKKNEISPYQDEKTRLKWAPVLSSLAFGESTAFYGFGKRIAESPDISTKSWLTIHLCDESKHAEGFSWLLHYLYPSYRGKLDSLLKSKDVYVFYGHTHRCDTLLQWLLCTQIAEVFGSHCYKALHEQLDYEPVAKTFFKYILTDESRHIAYIANLIQKKREEISDSEWQHHYCHFIEKMITLARNMFETRKKGSNYQCFESIGVNVTAFCDKAQSNLYKKLLVNSINEIQEVAQ